MLAQAAADDAETQALLALIELHGARLATRIDARGDPVLLEDQDRRGWDRGGIRRGLAALARANTLALAQDAGPGPLRLQAAIAACHATAPTFAATDWRQIAAHYATLFATTGSPAARIHEAQVAAQFDDPARVLATLDDSVNAQELDSYVPLHAVRGDLLERLGQRTAAADEFRLAARYSGNDAEQRLLLGRAQRAEAVLDPPPRTVFGPVAQDEGLGGGSGPATATTRPRGTPLDPNRVAAEEGSEAAIKRKADRHPSICV
jgi:RNA polymerase sigma-70 factor, ECF subfamily